MVSVVLLSYMAHVRDGAIKGIITDCDENSQVKLCVVNFHYRVIIKQDNCENLHMNYLKKVLNSPMYCLIEIS